MEHERRVSLQQRWQAIENMEETLGEIFVAFHLSSFARDKAQQARILEAFTSRQIYLFKDFPKDVLSFNDSCALWNTMRETFRLQVFFRARRGLLLNIGIGNIIEGSLYAMANARTEALIKIAMLGAKMQREMGQRRDKTARMRLQIHRRVTRSSLRRITELAYEERTGHIESENHIQELAEKMMWAMADFGRRPPPYHQERIRRLIMRVHDQTMRHIRRERREQAADFAAWQNLLTNETSAERNARLELYGRLRSFTYTNPGTTADEGNIAELEIDGLDIEEQDMDAVRSFLGIESP